jgi:glycosyltransferase involved in cell wall biosynthesis
VSEPRVLFWLADLGGGGAQRTMLNLAAAMPAHGLKVDLIVGQSHGPARAWSDPSLVFHELASDRLSAMLPSLTRTIRDRAPDVVLSTMMDANVAAYVAAKWSGRRPAVILRETNSHRARADLGYLRRRLARYVYRRADRLIALSEGVRNELIEDMALRPDRIVTVPNPVETATLARAAREARANVAPGILPAGRRHVVAVGRLHRQKGFDVLIEALAAQAPDVDLTILGEGPERGALEVLARQRGVAGRVHMPGFVPDVPSILAWADLFVLSSRWEGFGHVIVEAMAAGIPVLATDCPYGPRDILRHGETGWLVPPEAADALAAAMSQLLGDPALLRRMAAAGAIAAERYESVRVAGEYASVIRDTIARRRSGMAGSDAGRGTVTNPANR